MQWYYSKNGTQLGPVPQAELIAKLTSGEVSAADLIWREGMGDWLPAAQVAELREITAASTPVSSAPVADPYSAPISNPIPVAYSPVAAPSNGKATASMVLGIVSLVFGLCGCYGAIIAIPCGVLAVIFGGQFKTMVETNPGFASELGKAKSGIIMGWIGIGITVLFTVAIFVMGAASGVMQAMQK